MCLASARAGGGACAEGTKEGTRLQRSCPVGVVPPPRLHTPHTSRCAYQRTHLAARPETAPAPPAAAPSSFQGRAAPASRAGGRTLLRVRTRTRTCKTRHHQRRSDRRSGGCGAAARPCTSVGRTAHSMCPGETPRLAGGRVSCQTTRVVAHTHTAIVSVAWPPASPSASPGAPPRSDRQSGQAKGRPRPCCDARHRDRQRWQKSWPHRPAPPESGDGWVARPGWLETQHSNPMSWHGQGQRPHHHQPTTSRGALTDDGVQQQGEADAALEARSVRPRRRRAHCERLWRGVRPQQQHQHRQGCTSALLWPARLSRC